MIKIEHFYFTYPQADAPSLADINLEMEDGTLQVICGKSGCGKSTLLRNLKTALAPYGKKEGSIFYDGRKLEEMSEREQSTKIGFVLQNPDNQIVTDKVWHELAFGLESLGVESDTIRLRVAEMAAYFGIEDWFERGVSELSGGQKQLLNLASVMAMHPQVLILDEPTSQLDPIAASDFLETVKKINRDLGTTIIITEHRLQDIIPWADQITVLDEGRVIACGKPRKIGDQLKEMHHGMFLAMPVPMQLYAKIKNPFECPLTVAEGRRWLGHLMNGRREHIRHLKVTMPKIEESPVLEMKHVSFRYTKDGRDVLSDLTLHVNKGEFFAVVGGNGAGKSTALSVMGGLLKPYRGKTMICGKEITKYTDQQLYRELIGVLPQNPQSVFIKNTVEEDLYSVIGGRKEGKSSFYQSDMKKSQAVAGIASMTGLTHLMSRHPYDLSGGEQQRLALAKVLLLRPKILLLDEPTKGMDAQFKESFGNLLKRLQMHGITVIMISHDIEFIAEYADRVAMLFGGSVVTSLPSRAFFAGNNFYTTAANRMARHIFPEAVTGKDVIECLKVNQ